MSLATTVGACITLTAAVIVYRLLPATGRTGLAMRPAPAPARAVAEPAHVAPAVSRVEGER